MRADGLGRHVGRAGGDDVDTAPQPGGQRLQQVAVVHLGDAGQRRACRPDGDLVDLGGVDLHGVPGGQPGGDGRRDRARAAAGVHDDGGAADRGQAGERLATSRAVRCRGTKTPGPTGMRSPSNSAQPRTCSSGSPATRRRTSSVQLARRPACARSSRASSSAKTHPAARRVATRSSVTQAVTRVSGASVTTERSRPATSVVIVSGRPATRSPSARTPPSGAGWTAARRGCRAGRRAGGRGPR